MRTAAIIVTFTHARPRRRWRAVNTPFCAVNTRTLLLHVGDRSSSPPRKQRRRQLATRRYAIRRANRNLDDVQGARAHLLPLDGRFAGKRPGLQYRRASRGEEDCAAPPRCCKIDEVVDALCGARRAEPWMWSRTSRLKLTRGSHVVHHRRRRQICHAVFADFFRLRQNTPSRQAIGRARAPQS